MSKESLRMELVPPVEDCPYWVINFPDLFVGAQGESMSEAVQNGFVALKLWVDDCRERGVLDEALRDLKIEFLPPSEAEERVHWVAICPEIDLATQGDTFEDAVDNIKDALQEWLRYCIEIGTLEEVLQECRRGAYASTI